jgi:hypothetical protein
MIVTIVSPDKISISMFLSYMKFCLGKDHKIGMIQSLWCRDSIDKFIDENLKKNDKFLFSYYAKSLKQVSKDDLLKIIPDKLMCISDLVVWMDLFSTDWVVLKDTGNIAPSLIERWKKNINKMGG